MRLHRDLRSDPSEFSDIFPGPEGLGPLEGAAIPRRDDPDDYTGILPDEWFEDREVSGATQRSGTSAATITDPFARRTGPTEEELRLDFVGPPQGMVPPPPEGLFGIERRLRRGFEEGFTDFSRQWREPIVTGIADMIPPPSHIRELIEQGDWNKIKFYADQGALPSQQEIGPEFIRFTANDYTARGKQEEFKKGMALLRDPKSRRVRDALAAGHIPDEFWAATPRIPLVTDAAKTMMTPEAWPAVAMVLAADRFLLVPATKEILGLLGKELWTTAALKKTTLNKAQIVKLNSQIADPRLATGMMDAWKALSTGQRKYLGKMASKGVPVTVVYPRQRLIGAVERQLYSKISAAAKTAGIEPGTQAAMEHFLSTPLSVSDSVRMKIMDAAGVGIRGAAFTPATPGAFTIPTEHIRFRNLPVSLRESPIPTLPAIYKPQGIPSKGAPFPAAQIKNAGVPPKPKALAIPARAQSADVISSVVETSNYDAGSVKFLMEQGMTPAEITASSEVARDIIFQRGLEIPFEEVAARALPESEALARMWDRMTPVEGDAVMIPSQQQAGIVRQYNNDGTIQVEFPSGIKSNVQPGHVIKGEGLDIARRNVQELQAVTKPTTTVVGAEFSPTALASDILRSMDNDRLLTAISMASEGEHTVMDAVEHLAYAQPTEHIIKALAAEVGPEEFLDLAVNAVVDSPSVAPATRLRPVPATIQKAEETIESVRASIPDTTEQAAVRYGAKDLVSPEPYMVPLNTYLLGNAPPELIQLKNITGNMGFQSEQPNNIKAYIKALDRVVKKYMPERHEEFTRTVATYDSGQAKLSDLDAVYGSEIHARIAEIQFADEMEATGITDPMEAGMAAHRQSVEFALANRMTVPPEVLEQYPDLLEKYGMKESELEQPRLALDEVRQDNMEHQKERMAQTGEGTIPLGQSIQMVGAGGLPQGAKADKALADSMKRTMDQHPDLERSLKAGDEALGQHSGARGRLTAWRRLMGEVINPQMDKELRKTMPQYVDDKRTGLYTISSNAQVQALVDTGAMWGDLSKVQRETVMRTIFLRSFLQTGQEGMDLPGKLDLADVQQAYSEIEQVLKQQAPELLDVVDRYQQYMQALADEMVDRGWIKPADAKEFYAPHIVIDYTPHYFLERPFVSKIGRQPYRPYAHKRKGTARDIFANEEAIVSRIAQINADIAFDDWVTGQLETHDIFPKMTQGAKLQYFGTKASGAVSTPRPHGLYTVGRKEYRGYQYIPGNMVYRADVVDRSLLAHAFQDAMEDIAMAKTPADEKMIEDIANRGYDAIEKYLMGVGPRGGNALRSVRALGGRNRTYLIPTELYDDMNRLTSKGVQGAMTEVVHHLRTATKIWKTMATQVAGGLPFHMRNIIGDWQNMKKTGGFGPFEELPTAARILKNINDPSKLDPFEQRARELALDKDVIGSGFFRELASQAFRAQKLSQTDSLLQFWHWYQKMASYRELSNRVAMAAYQLKRYEAGLPLKHFDIKAKELDGLDMESKIGYIARNFTGDYGDVPAWYRRYASGLLFPFATFHQKNAVNWAKLITTPGKGRLKYLPMPVINNVVIPGAALYLWNHYGPYREIEDGLGFYRRKVFHMNLHSWDDDGDGRADRGLVLAPELPSDLALEMIGGDRLLENLDYVRRGVLTPKEAAVKQITDFGMAPLRMGERLLTPIAGWFIDVLRNKNPYTGTIVPKEEEGLPNWEKAKHYWGPHLAARTITPLSQYLAEERGDEPPLFGIPWIRRPLNVLGGLGFHVVDLHKETDREWYEMRRYVSSERARQMRKFRNSYVDSGMTILEYIASEDAAKILGETWRKDFAVQPGIEALKQGKVPTRGTLLGYLASPSVQLEALKKKLTRRGLSTEERIQINLRMRQMKERRRLDDFERIKFEEIPAIFRRLLRSADKKIEADNQRDE